MLRQTSTIVGLFLLFGSVAAKASQQIWQDMTPEQSQSRGLEIGARHFKADDVALRNLLGQVPHEALGDFSFQIELPMPDGKLALFEIVESPIMQPGLAADFPDFKTFRVFGIDDPFASGRVSISRRGFHGMFFTSEGRVFIDPDHAGQSGLYLSRTRSGHPGQGFSCGVHELAINDRPTPEVKANYSHRVPGMLLEYQLAVAATDDYVTAVGTAGAVANAQIEIGIAIDRVNVIYERDLGIRLTLVAGNQNLIEDGGNVAAVLGAPFSNTNGFALLTENQTWIDSNVPAPITAYDVGHVFSTGGGGVASLGAVCDIAIKAQGVTGQPDPTGDLFYIDFVAHEIGHQFNANHTFNGTTFSCFGNRNAATAVEPGSGTTIMAYAGICGVEDIQMNSDATFHARSIAEIDAFTGGAGACGIQIPTSPANNADPTITPIGDSTIPANTPFVLAGSANDAESGTAVLYQWDQMNAGTATDATTLGTDLGNNALFRTYESQNSASSRDFPALGTQVLGLYDDAEVMPCKSRDLDFRLTVRDNDSGQATEDVRITVAGNAGPFRVTSQAFNTTILFSNTTFLVSWDVANTDTTPVSCNNVAIDLLAFDDAAYTNHTVHTLVASTPNSGSAIVPAPSQWIENPARGRLRVRCLNNVFYALSEGDLQVVGDFPKTLFDDDDIATFFNNNGTTGGVAPICDAPSGIPTPIPSGTGDATAFGGIWLVLLGGLAVFRQLWRRQG
ncbi:MAG: M12 family metallo-peptidase [Gammaproteobacteria bacterium]|nr:M12 family metallo-peptidase [Gammaproteobacteria bacterium]